MMFFVVVCPVVSVCCCVNSPVGDCGKYVVVYFCCVVWLHKISDVSECLLV